MCNKIHFNTTTCPYCHTDFGSHGRLISHLQSGCNGRMPSFKRGIIATVAGIALAASLFVSPAKAQEPQPTPTPTTTSVGEPPHAIEMHRVYLPTVQFEAYVHGCDDCQAVSWRPTGS